MADVADRTLDCEVCCEQFDLTSRRPKLLSCGHTVCLTCVEMMHGTARNGADWAFQCPIDRTASKTSFSLAEAMADVADRTLDCEVCCEQFDLTSRRPKLLSCGHTVCLTCVEMMHGTARNGADWAFQCPIDRTKIRCRPAKLKDNYYIMSLIEETPGSKKPRYWCLDCKGVADAECQEEHTLRRLHLVRKSQMTPTMELLERAISTQHRLVEELEPVAASLSSYMTRQIAEIKEARAGAEKTLTRLSQGLDLVGSEWDAVEAAAEQARQSSNHRLAEDELSLQLLSSGGHCQVRLATTGGEAWRADVNLDGDVEGVADVRGLLVNMQRTGILHLVKNEVPDSQKNRLNDTQAVNSARLSAVQDTAMPASMQELSLAVTGERTTEKIATLQRDHTNVLCLRILRCDHDPAWACALIRKLRPTLEDLSAEGLRFEHLVAVQGMKQLRSLSIKYYQQCGLAGSHTPRKPRLLEELKLNVPLCDVWCWIRSFPPKALRLDLPDTVTLLDPDFVKTRYAMRSIRSCEDVTLEREVPYHGRATHASLCEEQRLAFVEDGCTVTRCSGCHEETRLA